jgi:hypothetical protein
LSALIVDRRPDLFQLPNFVLRNVSMFHIPMGFLVLIRVSSGVSAGLG